MAAYLRSWLPSSLPLATSPPTSDPAPESPTTPTVPIVELVDDDDVPPAFPALSSAQRASSSAPTAGMPRILSDDALMPPPPVPPVYRRSRLGVPASRPTGSSLMPPPSTSQLPTRSPGQKKREKVALAPGHSPLDWANLKTSGTDLRGGVTQPMRIPPSVLKQHNKQDDAWSVFNGKVYNITPYVDFHPGGAREIMRAAGRDGTKLFALTHSWVNVDYMLDACFIGFLVPEP
ncbi:cytochrome b5-like heme/steroid binding domain-containing protein, partial [Vararia minispora EC-137]